MVLCMAKAPEDPLQRLQWINEQQADLTRQRREALFEARLQGTFDEAVTISGLSRKAALAETRHENEARGRMVRWANH